MVQSTDGRAINDREPMCQARACEITRRLLAQLGFRPPKVRPHAPEKDWSLTCQGGGMAPVEAQTSTAIAACFAGDAGCEDPLTFMHSFSFEQSELKRSETSAMGAM